MTEPRFFVTPQKFRSWLEKNHAKKTELIVGYYKVGSGRPSITWPQSVDEALCFGWIDGVRRSLDEDSYSIRFTPRRSRSIWSKVNLARVPQLIEEGRMTAAGLKVFEARDVKKTNLYSFERDNVALTAAQEKQFRSNRAAWKFFESQPPSYRKPALWWVVGAKQETTRARRLATLIEDSAAHMRIAHLRRP